MPKRSTASELFKSVWRPLEELRAAKGVPQKTIAEKCGFKRTAWFDYARKGTIPFHMLERVAHFLDAKLQASVITEMSDGAGKSRASTTEEEMPDYMARIARELEKAPEEQRPFLAGIAVAKIQEEFTRHPSEPDAEQHARASRARSK